ncbi:MAG: STAS domain-containing protein [Gammaproteobacteria bacterium]|nr:STAS domain-containing protein [Gammaproteobacteria bacterium]
MKFQIKEEELRLSGKIYINDAERLLEVLTEYIQERKETAKIDLAEVEAMDITALQLLVAAKRTAKQAHKSFELSGVTGKLRETFELSGLDFLHSAPASAGSAGRGL